MRSRYLLVAFFGGLTGAACVLVAVYVTNAKALIIAEPDVNAVVSSLHSRINDFYIFAGIVITLLLAINVGVFVKADDEIDTQIKKSFGKHEEQIIVLIERYKKLINRFESTFTRQIHRDNDPSRTKIP